MNYLIETAVLQCDHLGIVQNDPKQTFVTVGGKRVLVETEPENWKIAMCPNLNPTTGIAPCKTALKVKEGYSTFVTVQGHKVCTDLIKGLTDGTPPGTVNYTVRAPGQTLVTEAK